MSQKTEKKPGRKPNEWTLLTFPDVAKHLSDRGIPVTEFAKTIGVSNQTFHNWKSGRCAPTEGTQRKILGAIQGVLPEEADMTQEMTAAPIKAAKRKTAKRKDAPTKATRGKGSVTLAALSAAAPSAEDTAAVQVPGKVGRRPGPRKAAPPAKTVKAAKAHGTNGAAHLSPTSWAELGTLGAFLRANPDKTREQVAEIIDVARELV